MWIGDGIGILRMLAVAIGVAGLTLAARVVRFPGSDRDASR